MCPLKRCAGKGEVSGSHGALRMMRLQGGQENLREAHLKAGPIRQIPGEMEAEVG